MKIDKHNYEEWLLRSIDNDLSANEAKALDKFLSLHPEYREELDAFEKAVLIPEPMLFVNKASLYREVAETKVIPLWQRPSYWAVAASLALVVGLSIWFLSRSSSNQNVATQKDPVTIHQPLIDSASKLKSVETQIHQGVQDLASTKKQLKHTLPESTKRKIESSQDQNNFAFAVTNRDDVSLQPIETYPMIQFQLNQSNPVAEPRNIAMVSERQRSESTATRLVTNALKLSGNSEWAHAFERYSHLNDKKIELSFNSEKLNLHKTLFLNN